nr:putative PEP-binding protein [Entomoplasma sp. MP1]
MNRVAAHADKFSKYADFSQSEQNDLIQYSMAADRMRKMFLIRNL